MKHNEESIYNLIEIIELYIYQQYGIEVDILIQDYTNDGIKFHYWIISPIEINGEKYTKIKLSEMNIDDLNYSKDNLSIKDVISMNKDLLGGCLKQ